MQGLCAQLTVGVYLPSIYICVQCSSMQGLYARLTRGFIYLLSTCIVIDLAVGVVVWKASVLD